MVRLLSVLCVVFFTAVPRLRRPPPFENLDLSFEVITVESNLSPDSQISYRIKATPDDCASGFPLLDVGFLQVTDLSNL